MDDEPSGNLWQTALGGAAIIGGLLMAGWLIYRFWHRIRDEVAAWLRRNNLQESALMDVWITFDTLTGAVRRRVFARTPSTGECRISETMLSAAEVEALKHREPDVYAALRERGLAQKNLLYLFQ